MTSNRLINVFATTKISFLSYPIQNNSIIDNITSISQSTHGPYYTMRIFSTLVHIKDNQSFSWPNYRPSYTYFLFKYLDILMSHQRTLYLDLKRSNKSALNFNLDWCSYFEFAHISISNQFIQQLHHNSIFQCQDYWNRVTTIHFKSP